MDAVRLRPISEAAIELEMSRATIWRVIRRLSLKTYRREFDKRTWVDVDELRDRLKFREID